MQVLTLITQLIELTFAAIGVLFCVICWAGIRHRKRVRRQSGATTPQPSGGNDVHA